MKKTIIVSLALASALFATDSSWIIAPKYGALESTNKYKAVTTIPAIPALGIVNNLNEDRNTNHDLLGLRIGKEGNNYRYYADYDRFTYKKDPNKFGDKDVNGWLMTINADYMYPVHERVKLFGGGALIIAGAKPEGMKSSPALAAGINAGITADVYKMDSKNAVFFEAGYRYIRTQVKSTETMVIPNDPNAGGLTTSTDIEVNTNALKGWYFSVGYKF
jgi:hypothetical protein